MRIEYGVALIKRAAVTWRRPQLSSPAATVTRILQVQPYTPRKRVAKHTPDHVTINTIVEEDAPLDGTALDTLDTSLQPCEDTNPAPDAPKKRGRKPKAANASSEAISVSNKPTSKATRTLTIHIKPGLSPNHTDLPTFLAYATKSSLSPTSKVYLGTHFEYTVQASLARLGFTLTRVGGPSDLGIDLIGHWTPPSPSSAPSSSPPSPKSTSLQENRQPQQRLPTLIQCKASPPKSSLIRELSGAHSSSPPHYKHCTSTITLLVASHPATKGVRDAVSHNPLPMGFLCVEAVTGVVRQFVWNQSAVEKCGLEGVGVGVRLPVGDVVLTWEGMPWSPST